MGLTARPSQSFCVAVEDVSGVGEARRLASELSRQAGYSENARSDLAIVVNELGKNLLQHAGRGKLVLRRLARDGVPGIELLSLDRGPGMRDVRECLQDGFSTRGTSGIGLGASARLSHTFDIYSRPGQGTCVLSRTWAAQQVSSTSAWAPEEVGVGARSRSELGVVCAPKSEEDAAGDDWALRESGTGGALLVVDGLGHGRLAAEAACAATETFRADAGGTPTELLLERMHQRLRSTRGAAAAIAEWEHDGTEVRFWGVGNVAGALVTPGTYKGMVSSHGTLGLELPRPKARSFTYPWPPGAALILHTDGIGSRWDLAPYPGLLRRDPALIAAILYRDFERGKDDATVVVLRKAQPRK